VHSEPPIYITRLIAVHMRTASTVCEKLGLRAIGSPAYPGSYGCQAVEEWRMASEASAKRTGFGEVSPKTQWDHGCKAVGLHRFRQEGPHSRDCQMSFFEPAGKPGKHPNSRS
jgi:hypothetical protein